MTAAANRSANHVGSMNRWQRQAREANPTLSDEQVDRLAERLRTDYFSRIGRLSGIARRARADVA